MKLIIQTHLIHPEGSVFEGELSTQNLIDAQTSPLFAFSGPMQYKLNASLSNSGLYVKGTLQAPYTARCARCLSDFSGTIEVPDLTLYFEEIPDDGKIDIGEDLREELLIGIPEHPHCSEDCRGLCPHCGVNLNTEPCRCHTPENDSDSPNPWQSLDTLNLS